MEWWHGNPLFDEKVADDNVQMVLRQHGKITTSLLTKKGVQYMAFLTKDENGNIVAVKEWNQVTLEEIDNKIAYYTNLKNQYLSLSGSETAAPATPAAPADQPAQTIPATDNQGNVVAAGGQAATPSVDVAVTPAQPAVAQPAAPAAPADPNAPAQPPQVFPQ